MEGSKERREMFETVKEVVGGVFKVTGLGERPVKWRAVKEI